MNVGAYLYFNGRAQEAIEFYKSALGAKLNVSMKFKDSPVECPGMTPDVLDKIMHAELAIGQTVLCLSDGDCKSDGKFSNFSMSLAAETDEEAARVFKSLAEKGNIIMPMDKTFFASSFGMVSDQFGVPWMVIKNAG